jgi:catechol 2,3-dioxygenase-like lactoylglutathione lyase family enzyme
MMLDHIAIPVSDFARSKEFYTKALRPLYYELVMEVEGAAGFGAKGKPEFWFGEGDVRDKIHIAFAAENREQVRKFYEAALAAGGKDNGPPGLRAHYHPNYYGAFVLDPDGHNIEAVCHKPE